MDYGVKYSMLVNGTEAVQELTKFQNAVSKTVPTVNKKLNTVHTKMTTIVNDLERMQTLIRKLNRTRIDFKMNSATADLKKIKKDLAAIKNKKVRVTIDERRTSNGKSVSSSSSRRSVVTKNRSFNSKTGAFGRSFAPTSMMSAGGIPFATTIGAGMIGLGLRAIIGESAEFQHTMTSVRAILRATDDDAATFQARFDDMSKSMRKLGVDTKFTAVEIGEATRFLSMAGFNVATIEKSMKSVTNLAMIGDSDLGEMADIITNVMTGYGIGADQISAASDNMAAVISRSNVNTLEIGESMKYASNYMRMAGVDFSEGAAAIGILGNAGIKGSRAGTSMRAMLIRLIKPTNKAQEVIDRLGLTFTKTVTEGGKTRTVIKPLIDIFKELKGAGASMEDLTAVFDKIGGGAAMALIDNIERWEVLRNAGQTSAGLADFLAEEKMKTVSGLAQQIKSKFLDLGLTLFNKISPQLNKVMTDLLGWMKGDEAADMFNSITRGIGSVIGGLKDTTLFMKNNWHWLKFVFGGMAVGAVGKRAIGGAVGMYNTGKGVVGGLSAIGKVAGFGGAGLQATASVTALTASLTALVAGGAIAIGITAIAAGIWRVHRASKSVALSSQEVADWSVSRVGLNTEGLDILEAKLRGVHELQKNIEGVKDAAKKKSTNQQSWESSVGEYHKVRPLWFGGDRKDVATQQMLASVSSHALGGAGGKQINEIFRKAVATGNFGSGSHLLTGLNATYASRAAQSSRSSILDSGFRGGSAGYNDMLQSTEYMSELARYSQVMMGQLSGMDNALSSTGPNKSIQVLTALDAMLKDTHLSGLISDMKTGDYKSGKDIQNRMMVRGLSPMGIRTTLASLGFGADIIDKIFAAGGLAGTSDSSVTSSGSTSNVRNEQLDDMGQPLSGAGAMGEQRSGKMIMVNIDKLWNVENANFQNEDDLESTKDKIAEALIDVVNDFSISNF